MLQVLSGNLTFRTPQQSANAAAPTAAYNLTSARIATSIDTLAPGPAASSELGSYTLTATKRNGTALSNVQGPQFTTQVCCPSKCNLNTRKQMFGYVLRCHQTQKHCSVKRCRVLKSRLRCFSLVTDWDARIETAHPQSELQIQS